MIMTSNKRKKLNNQRESWSCHEDLTRIEVISSKTVIIRTENSLRSWSSLAWRSIHTDWNQSSQKSCSHEFMNWDREEEFNNQRTASSRLYVNIHLQIHEEENVDKMQDMSNNAK